jgi:hypothetical protein
MVDDDKAYCTFSGLNDHVTSAADDQAPAIFQHSYQSCGAFENGRAVELDEVQWVVMQRGAQ